MPATVTHEIGSLVVYGTWSDVHDHQFIVDWHESGSTCTVILLSGSDYGGGVTYYAEIPYKEVDELIENSSDDLSCKMDMISLVNLYKKK